MCSRIIKACAAYVLILTLNPVWNEQASVWSHAQQPDVKISSRVSLGDSMNAKFTELVGGSRVVKRKDWSYLAFVDKRGNHVETGPSFVGLSFDVLAQFDARHFWALATSTVQGHKSWMVLVVTHDVGMSWKVVDLHEAFEQAGRMANQRIYVAEIVRVEFRGPDDGQMELITEETRKHIVLKTRDGGFHWMLD